MLDMWARYLVAGMQFVLTGEAEVVDGELRIPADCIDRENDGLAVSLNQVDEPGTIIIKVTKVPVSETLELTDDDFGVVETDA